MAKIEWSDSLSLGIGELDGHHKELLRIMSMLLDALHKNENEDTITILLTKLREYTIYHFNAEEAFMEEIHYPLRLKHVQRHTELKRKVKALQYSRFHHENLSSDDYKKLLSAWLLDHILDYDFKVAKYLSEQKNKPEDFRDKVKKEWAKSDSNKSQDPEKSSD
ncbi:bacteriohemerythrin [Maridesulfovibrio frigidus]|uniref:bacteriohemerythrin n=1 Tax=Maridesulfovibrio frigidus TaxID=340956 RepID=UPI000691D09D|nr:bacteriohemerythrin [Maridesulfovibrio frigidus]